MKIKLFLLPLILAGLVSCSGTSSGIKEFSFVAMSDSRGSNRGVNEAVLSTFVDHLMKNQGNVKFVVFAGDLADGNKNNPAQTIEQWKNWRRIMAPIYKNPNMLYPGVFVTIGNHEIQKRQDEDNFRITFPEALRNGPADELGLTYSMDYNNSHFVFLATERWHYGNPGDTSAGRRDWHYIKHLDWLENDLSQARKKNTKHIFIIGHDAAFPIGGHLRDALPNLGVNLTLPLDSTRQWYLNQRNLFWKILRENNVDAYICGHEHLYGRESVNGVFQIVAGSSGAPLYHFNPKYGENPENKPEGQELTYDEALPYYKILSYNYKPDGNAQASEDFFGQRAFEYVVFEVKNNKVEVKTYGAFPKEGTLTIMGTDIRLIDQFTITQ